MQGQVDVRRPPAVRSGDAVAVVSPSSAVPVERLEAGLEVLASWGLRPFEGRHARAVHGHLAGTDAQRIADLNAAFRDPAVRAVWASRGGYGLTRIVDRLDWDALAADPKVLVGFSDVTALLVSAWRRIGLCSVHGQVVARLHLLTDAARARVRSVVFGDPAASREEVRGIVVAGTATAPRARASASEPVGGDRGARASAGEPVGGDRRGPLVGGNVAVLASMVGTADQLRTDGCILLLEEVDEAPYRVDRLLTQLRGSGALEGVAGIAVATPVRCAAPGVPSATFDEVVRERLGDLGVPLVTDLPLGHVDDQFAFVHGASTVLDTTQGTLRQHEGLGSPTPR